MRRSKNKAYIYVPMAIVLDEQFPFRSNESSEMIDVELSIQDGALVVRQIEPQVTDSVQLLYE